MPPISVEHALPAPVGRTRRVAAVRDSRHFSVTAGTVSRVGRGNEERWPSRMLVAFRSRPDRESGIMWARLSVEIGGWQDIGVGRDGQDSEPGLGPR